MTKRQRAFVKGFIQAGACATALIAIIGAWHLIGAPLPAWSSDINRLDKTQAELAVEIYDRKVRAYLTSPPPSDPVNKQIWDEDLRRARGQLDAAEKRRIELSK